MCRPRSELLGTRLRALRQSYKDTRTPLSGRGKLTDKAINSLQNYFGMAIRQNKGALYQMKKAVAAILWHCTDIKEAEWHPYCPREANSWCKWDQGIK